MVTLSKLEEKADLTYKLRYYVFVDSLENLRMFLVKGVEGVEQRSVGSGKHLTHDGLLGDDALLNLPRKRRI